MRVAWIHWGGAAFTAALTLLAGAPLNAADEASVRYVAEELGNRTKAPEAEQTAPKGLSDSAVRVMSTFALSILPDQVPDPSGEMVKLDKSDPNKYLIPLDDARRLIGAAGRGEGLCGRLGDFVDVAIGRGKRRKQLLHRVRILAARGEQRPIRADLQTVDRRRMHGVALLDPDPEGDRGPDRELWDELQGGRGRSEDRPEHW